MSAPYDGSMAGATQYGMYQDAAKKALQDATARIHTQRSGYLRDQGYGATYGADGNLTGISVLGGDDARGGAYQTLHRDMAYQGEDQQAAQAGLGFGGGLARQMGDQAQQGYEDATSAQGRDVQSQLFGPDGFGSQEQGLNADYNDQMYQTFMDIVRQDQADGKFNPADYKDLVVPGYGNPLAPGAGGSTSTPPGPWQPPAPPNGKRTSHYGNYNAAGKWIPWVPKKKGGK